MYNQRTTTVLIPNILESQCFQQFMHVANHAVLNQITELTICRDEHLCGLDGLIRRMNQMSRSKMASNIASVSSGRQRKKKTRIFLGM